MTIINKFIVESEKVSKKSVNGAGDSGQNGMANGTTNGVHHSNGTNGVANGKDSPPKTVGNGTDKTDAKKEIASELFGVCHNLNF